MIDPRSLCQIEIQVSDPERSLAFYEAVFGWHRTPTEIHDYYVLAVPEGCPFGISLVPAPGAGGGQRTVLYFAVDDPSAIIERAQKHGGTLKFGPRRLSSYGEIWQIADPDGQRIGLFRRKTED